MSHSRGGRDEGGYMCDFLFQPKVTPIGSIGPLLSWNSDISVVMAPKKGKISRDRVEPGFIELHELDSLVVTSCHFTSRV